MAIYKPPLCSHQMSMNHANHASVMVDEVMFRETYVPEKLHARDNQVQEILRCLSPALKKRKPIHLWLHGRPGTGKTSTALHILKHMKEKNGIDGLRVNCWEKDTFFEVLDEIISQLKILSAEEHRTSLKLEKLRKHLGDQPFIVILDEVDQLKPAERSTTLYNLESLGNVGVICISNSQQALLELDERVRSRLNPWAVSFAEYNSKDLMDILNHRAELALAAGVWSDRTLRQIVDMSSGDARVAVRSLKAAAELAETERLDAISTHAIRKQWNEAQEAKKACILKNLTEDHRILYEIVEQKRQILSGDLWREYQHRCTLLKRKPLASRTFSDYANRLVQAGLITSERARVKGKVRLFKFCR